MINFFKNIIRFVLFLGVQVYVLNNVPPLHHFISPVIYYLFLLWLPFSTDKFWLLIIGFLLGLSFDYFLMTPGLHAAGCVLIMYLRPALINLFVQYEKNEFTYREPSAAAMGWAPFLTYVFILTIVYHGYISFLEWLQFGNFLDFLFKIISSSIISMLLVITLEVIFQENKS